MMLQVWHTVYLHKLHRSLRPLAAGNALQWSLRKLDARLAESEKNPTASDQAAWRLGSGPVGVTAAKGVSKAAQLSITAGQKVIKVIFQLFRCRCTSVGVGCNFETQCCAGCTSSQPTSTRSGCWACLEVAPRQKTAAQEA